MTTKDDRYYECKGKLLEHYAHRDPTAFFQFDGWALGPDGGDSVMRPDADGDCLTSSQTYELMTGGPSVRVLVTRGTSRPDAVRLLKKLRRWVKQSDLVWPDAFEVRDDSSDGVPF